MREQYGSGICVQYVSLSDFTHSGRDTFSSKAIILIPGTYGFKSQADYILTDYLNGCAYNESYTLTAYNARMKKLGMKPLTNLTSDMEDGK